MERIGLLQQEIGSLSESFTGPLAGGVGLMSEDKIVVTNPGVEQRLAITEGGLHFWQDWTMTCILRAKDGQPFGTFSYGIVLQPANPAANADFLISIDTINNRLSFRREASVYATVSIPVDFDFSQPVLLRVRYRNNSIEAYLKEVGGQFVVLRHRYNLTVMQSHGMSFFGFSLSGGAVEVSGYSVRSDMPKAIDWAGFYDSIGLGRANYPESKRHLDVLNQLHHLGERWVFGISGWKTYDIHRIVTWALANFSIKNAITLTGANDPVVDINDWWNEWYAPMITDLVGAGINTYAFAMTPGSLYQKAQHDKIMASMGLFRGYRGAYTVVDTFTNQLKAGSDWEPNPAWYSGVHPLAPGHAQIAQDAYRRIFFS